MSILISPCFGVQNIDSSLHLRRSTGQERTDPKTTLHEATEPRHLTSGRQPCTVPRIWSLSFVLKYSYGHMVVIAPFTRSQKSAQPPPGSAAPQVGLSILTARWSMISSLSSNAAMVTGRIYPMVSLGHLPCEANRLTRAKGGDTRA